MVRKLIDGLRRLFGIKPPEPHDPYAGVRAPVKRGPLNRSGAVAVEEPDEN